MKTEFNKNPGERNSSQVRSKASKEKKDVRYIEVVPSLPMYHMDYLDCMKVLKVLFVPGEDLPAKLVVESNHGSIRLIDWDSDLMVCSTIREHPDTVESSQVELLLFMYDLEADGAVWELSEWGITKVSFKPRTDKIVSTKAFFEAYKTFVLNKAEELIIKCEDGEELRFPYYTIYSLKEES